MTGPRQSTGSGSIFILCPATAILAIMFLLTIFAAQVAPAQTFNVIYSFTGGTDGYQSYAGLTLDGANNLYGTTTTDITGFGTVFQLKRGGGNWVLQTLHTFDRADGASPEGRPVFGPDGTLYGTAGLGGVRGFGTVYNLRQPANACHTTACPWKAVVLYSFLGGNDGIGPGHVDPVFDRDGNLYGTTYEGGSGFDHAGGIVFELTPANGRWTESVIYSFPGTDHPGSGVIFDTAGNLYGTTTNGQYAFGAVYELSPSGSGWTASTLYTFQGDLDGAVPIGGLVFDHSGNLFGTTITNRFSNGGGTVFELSPSGGNWTFDLVYGLTGIGTGGPQGNLVVDAAGNLYGAAYTDGALGFGSVFKLTPTLGGWTYTSLHDFTGGADGGLPIGGPTMDANGNLYGTTSTGGIKGGTCPFYGCGVIWEITP